MIDPSPTIAINGNATLAIPVGAAYADLGASITGRQSDLNLVFIPLSTGALDPVVIDTCTTRSDPVGLTSTSTRTVIVSAPANGNHTCTLRNCAAERLSQVCLMDFTRRTRS